MQQIINFFIRNKTFILFLLLLFVSLVFTIQSHSYHASKFINSANWLTGGIYSSVNNINQYFNLKQQNEVLVAENLRLRKILFSQRALVTDSLVADSTLNADYKIYSAPVIKNSFANQKNYITIKGGSNQGIKQDMGVITSTGIVGIVEKTSKNYAVVQSVLNTLSEINAQLKNTNHFGTLRWDGKDYRTVQLVDVSRVAPLKEGDTVITGGMSTIFPKGLQIGRVKSFEEDASGNYYIINLTLFTDMTSLGHVYVIENTKKEEIKNLEATVNDQ